MKFKNPSDESVETIPATARLWALLFGPIYFAAKGLWVLAVVETVLCIVMLADPKLIAIIWIAFALSADTALAKRYRRRGWVAEGVAEEGAAPKQKTSLVVWLLLLLMIPAFIYFAASQVA